MGQGESETGRELTPEPDPVRGVEPGAEEPGGEWRARLRAAAIQAEYETGYREETEEEARRGVIRRVATIVVGFVVLFGGIAMMILPGPGVLGIIAGLAILAQELAWAERLLEHVKRWAKVDEIKQQPWWIQVLMWSFTVLAVVASVIYFTVVR